MNDYWIDIPNLQTVNLPGSFQIVQSKSITSIWMIMNEWIDISPILANLVQSSDMYSSSSLSLGCVLSRSIYPSLLDPISSILQLESPDSSSDSSLSSPPPVHPESFNH